MEVVSSLLNGHFTYQFIIQGDEFLPKAKRADLVDCFISYFSKKLVSTAMWGH